MNERVGRRTVLRAAAATAGIAGVDATGAVADRQTGAGGFAPTRHGYGFPNWSSRDQHFEVEAVPSRRSIRDRIRSRWRGQAVGLLGLDVAGLPGQCLDALATQLRLAVAQGAGTNGHCYGMSLTAQQYFERPEAIPVDRRTASEIEAPTVPVEEPRAPVYESIVEAQAEQFLRFRAWLGRRAMLYPDWIDTERVLGDVGSVVDRFGTASIMVFDGSLYGHQVLAYGVEDRGDAVVVPIYDPNRAAATYRGGRTELRFERDGEGVSMRPYGQYDRVLFNRWDRVERATGREDAGPLDHLTVEAARLESSLFPLALVLVDAAGVELTVVSPTGRGIDRLRGEEMDRSRGAYARMRSVYGAAPGTYRVGVFGVDATDYELTTVVADPDGTVVDASHAGSIEPGVVHEYDLEVPPEGAGSVRRAGARTLEPALLAGAGALGGTAVGALGYRALDRRRDEPDAE